MLGGIGPMELIIVGGIVVLLFGGKKLPQLGGAIGESIKNFKKGVKDIEDPKLEAGSAEAKDKAKDNEPIKPT